MNKMTVQRFLSSYGACAAGREYAMDYSTMHDVYESLLQGKAGWNSFRWVWWILFVGCDQDKDMRGIMQKIQPYFYEVLRSLIGDEAVELSLGAESRTNPLALEKAIEFGGLAGAAPADLRREVVQVALLSLEHNTPAYDYLHGTLCLEAASLMRICNGTNRPVWLTASMRICNGTNRPVWLTTRSLLDENSVNLVYSGEDVVRSVPIVTQESQAPFLAKLREFGNPFEKEIAE